MQQDIKEAVAAAWAAAWDRGEVEAFDGILHPEYRRLTAGNGNLRDAAYLKQEILDIRAAFPDLVTTVDNLLVDEAEGEAAIFWRSTGTFTHDLPGVPATGNRVETRGSNLLTLRGGLIVSERVTWDRAELLEDLGVPSLRSAFEEPEEVVVDNLSGVPSIDALKGFNRQFITGVTVVTTIDDEGRPRGLAANSYASVSLDPPLVLVCVQKTTSTHDPLFKSSHLGINIMSTGQRDTVGVFASKAPDKFAEVEWHRAPHGSPLLEGSAASIEAEIKERFLTKTHTVFISKVTHAEASDLDALIYKGGKFYASGDLEQL
ncbi:flavin reductase [Leucobacter tenebrionis]|uniref:flavin reductase n=1 Tax=Leucobacter tenebrionis TaxID=2873270 RepID=UPI001CA62450|nr:flavin reductase [Leucobacter tenebrionis]QZY51025.1 flavin reductase [Leucobacter tenebrionis]